jgi:hypothetical protein
MLVIKEPEIDPVKNVYPVSSLESISNVKPPGNYRYRYILSTIEWFVLCTVRTGTGTKQ